MFTRRELTLGAFAWQHAHQNAASGKLTFLTAALAAEIEALCAEIIPSSDGTPGARETGAIYFIDHALADWDRGQREAYRTGMEDVQRRRQRMFPQSASVAGLSSSEVIALLRAIEKMPFFEVLRTHTILGFVGPPSRGGNREHAGWTHIGVEAKMIFTPPFGYYDAGER
jgi:gluconate 2-dehydrogenase gamma chain